MKTSGLTPFDKRGFYLHASWKYEYPFAVRTWSHKDYASMFQLLRSLGLNRVMIWPMTEVAPPPLSSIDQEYLTGFRKVIHAAKDCGLDCWLVFCANVSSTDTIRSLPFQDRVFYPNMRKFRLDEAKQFSSYMTHLRDLIQYLNNADGYVFIDGDPGGYPGANPEDFMVMLDGVRRILDEVCPDQSPKVIPWVWSGWGADWETEGVWKPDLRKLVRPFFEALKAHPPAEPWELLPGRSIREGHANGRINIELTEEADLLDRSTLLTYEIIEFEPTPPAFVIQFDDIRRVIRQEERYSAIVRGIMGNAQQPITSLHNLFYFARCTSMPNWIDKSDDEILHSLADFLGGNAEILVPAWTVAHTPLDRIPLDLDERVRDCDLRSETAQLIPGGEERYVSILAEFVKARISVLHNTSLQPLTKMDAAQRLTTSAVALVRWWSLHRYVYSGNNGPDFNWEHTHPVLLQPLMEWLRTVKCLIDKSLQQDVADELAGTQFISRDTAEKIVRKLLRGLLENRNR
jgi:hypothetical protein